MVYQSSKPSRINTHITMLCKTSYFIWRRLVNLPILWLLVLNIWHNILGVKFYFWCMYGDVRTTKSILANVCLLPDEWGRTAQITWTWLLASPVKNRALQAFLYQPMFVDLLFKLCVGTCISISILLHCSNYSLNQIYLHPFKNKRRQVFRIWNRDWTSQIDWIWR